MSMNKEYRRELNRLKKLRNADARAYIKITKRINAEFEREQRAYGRRNEKLNRRIAILEGRLS